MDIGKTEYEHRRDVFEFCAWIESQLLLFSRESNFEADYFERRGNNIKKLIEEAIPISRLALHLHRAFTQIHVQCLSGNQPFDAYLYIRTPTKAECIKVEATTTENEDSTMRRQGLSRIGFVHLTGRISRQGRKITSEGEMVDVDKAALKAIQLGFERMKTKVERVDSCGAPYYDKDTAILVHVDFFGTFSIRHRAQLMEWTQQYMRSQQPSIYGIYYCYSANHGVDGLRNWEHDLW